MFLSVISTPPLERNHDALATDCKSAQKPRTAILAPRNSLHHVPADRTATEDVDRGRRADRRNGLRHRDKRFHWNRRQPPLL